MANAKNYYTDAPDLHANPILRAFQILVWIFCHPSAWNNYITRTNPDIPPDFSLLGSGNLLKPKSALVRLLFLEICFVLFLSGVLAFMMLNLLAISQSYFWLGILFTILVSFFFMFLGLAVFNAAVGFGMGVSISLTCVGVVWAFATEFSPNPWIVACVGLGIGICFSIASDIGNQITGSRHFASFRESIASGIIGIIVSAAMIAFVGYITFSIANPFLIFIAISTLSASSFSVYVKRFYDWKRSILVGIFIGSIFSLMCVALFSITSGLWLLTFPQSFTVGFIIGLGGVQTILTIIMSSSRQLRLVISISTGIVAGSLLMVANALPGESSRFVTWGLMCLALITVPFSIAKRTGGDRAAWIATGLSMVGGWIFVYATNQGSFDWLMFLVGISGIMFGFISEWRSFLLYIFELVSTVVLFNLDKSHRPDAPWLLRWHPAFWDENQKFKFVGLEKHLLLVMAQDPEEGNAALSYLIASKNHRWAAQDVQVEMYARQLESCKDVFSILNIHKESAMSRLIGPAGPLLRKFDYISRDLKNVEDQTSSYVKCMMLNSIEYNIDDLLKELLHSKAPYALRFQLIAEDWRHLIQNHRSMLEQTASLSDEIINPYIVGLPLTRHQEIFIGRQDIEKRIKQLILSNNRVPLLLYGQKRIGKTSLLHNLSNQQLHNIIPLFVDGQAIASAADFTDLLFNIAKEMISFAEQQQIILPPLQFEQLTAYPVTSFNLWLDKVESFMKDQGKTALLMLDEFEILDHGIKKGRFDAKDFFSLLRHLIQYRQQFQVLLSGSHSLEEFDDWASYLNNTQVIKISYLKKEEALRLITHPVKTFNLNYDSAASERVYELTQGHPCLIQLLCFEIVALKNEQEAPHRRQVTTEDVELSLIESLSRGRFIFKSLEEQVDANALRLLNYIAQQGEQREVAYETLNSVFPENLDKMISSLEKNDFIAKNSNGYHFQVEMIRRWFASYSNL
jgi:hypothetical protein